MKRLLLIIALCTIAYFMKPSKEMQASSYNTYTFWEIQSIDTMKYSRDVAREKHTDPAFDAFIDMSVKNIASAGATHVAIGTPYDQEFTPFLERWVKAARKHKLKVWFRGNMSGWEEWFGYQKISREQHTSGVLTFIELNKHLFENGDLFTSCPECENGGPGDPRFNNDVAGHRAFLINEYTEVKKAFKKIKKNVQSNTYSMNGDVTKLIMDPETTIKLDGLIVPDHYSKTPEKTLAELRGYAQKSGGKVILGEFGIPIPDIHGAYNEDDQATWLSDFYTQALDYPEVIGFNYWTHIGGSTELWNSDGTPRKAVEVIRKFYAPEIRKLQIDNIFGRRIKRLSISHGKSVKTFTEKNNDTIFAFVPGNDEVIITAEDYNPIKFNLSSLPKEKAEITLQLVKNDFFSKIRAFFFQ